MICNIVKIYKALKLYEGGGGPGGGIISQNCVCLFVFFINPRDFKLEVVHYRSFYLPFHYGEWVIKLRDDRGKLAVKLMFKINNRQ